MKLSEKQVTQYFEEGYLVLPGLIDSVCLASYNQRFEDLVEGRVALAPGMKIMQDVMVAKGAVKPASALHGVNKMLCLEEDPVLFGFARHPELVEAVQSLLGQSIFSLSSNVFNRSSTTAAGALSFSNPGMSISSTFSKRPPSKRTFMTLEFVDARMAPVPSS